MCSRLQNRFAKAAHSVLVSIFLWFNNLASIESHNSTLAVDAKNWAFDDSLKLCQLFGTDFLLIGYSQKLIHKQILVYITA